MKAIKKAFLLSLLTVVMAVTVNVSFTTLTYGAEKTFMEKWDETAEPVGNWAGPLYSAGESIRDTAKPYTSKSGAKSLFREAGTVKGRDINSVARGVADQTRNTARVLETTGKYLDMGDKVLTVVESAGALSGGDVVGAGQAVANDALSGAAASGGAWAGGKAGAVIGGTISGPPGAVIGGGVGAVIGAVGSSYAYDKYGKPVVDKTADKISREMREIQAAAEKDAARLRTDLAVIEQVRQRDSTASARSSGEDTADIWNQQQNLPLSREEARRIHERAEEIRVAQIAGQVRRLPADKAAERIKYLEGLLASNPGTEARGRIAYEIGLLNNRLNAPKPPQQPKPEKKLATITISPNAIEMLKGQSKAFSATGIFSDNSTTDITGIVQWSGGAGNTFTAQKGGTFTIRATYMGATGTATVIVKKTPVALKVFPVQKTVKINESAGFTAMVTYDDGTTADVTTTAVWTPGNTFTGNTSGIYSVTATFGNVSSSATVTVRKTIVSLSLAPTQKTIAVNESASFTARASFDDGSAEDVTDLAHWTPGSSFASPKEGAYTIIAIYRGMSGKATVTVKRAIYIKDATQTGYDPRKDPGLPGKDKPVDTDRLKDLAGNFQQGQWKPLDTRDQNVKNQPAAQPQLPGYLSSTTTTAMTTVPPEGTTTPTTTGPPGVTTIPTTTIPPGGKTTPKPRTTGGGNISGPTKPPQPPISSKEPPKPAKPPTEPPKPPQSPKPPTGGAQKYAVFLVKGVFGGAGYSVVVCDVNSSFLKGKEYQKKSADFNTKAEADKAYCGALQSNPYSVPLTGGSKAKIYGGDYWVGDATPSCPKKP